MTEFYNPEVQQIYPDSCAIKSQQLILNDFGINVSEVDLVQIAAERGWYNGGTTPEDVGKLLELANIPITQQYDANVFNLVNELAQGHKVIVGVDSDELWYGDNVVSKFINWLKDFFHGEIPNHALIVAGIDTSDPENVKVIITDPGTGEEGKPYPLEQFMDAWADSKCYMMSTDLSVPNVIKGMENFNYNVGHIDNISGMDYHDFQIFNDLSYGIPCGINYYPNIPNNYSPMSSLVDACFDVAHNEIPFNQIFTPAYEFNNYMDFNIINPAMCDTFTKGVAQMNMYPYEEWDLYAKDNGITQMTNWDYQNFLADTISNFTPATDPFMMDFYNQQMMMLDYCNLNQLDFGNTIYNPCMDLFCNV